MELKEQILKTKPIKYKWFFKLVGGEYTKSEYYWKLKELFGKGFSIEHKTFCGSIIREYGIQLLGEFDDIIITSDFKFVGSKEMAFCIDKAFKELYDNFVLNVEKADEEELKNLWEKVKKYKKTN